MNQEVKEFLGKDFDKVKKAVSGMATASDIGMGEIMDTIIACGLRINLDELRENEDYTISVQKDLFFKVLEKNRPFFTTYGQDFQEKMEKFTISISPKGTSGSSSQETESPPQK